MINKHEGCSRGFIRWSKSSSPEEREDEWDETVEKIIFGLYADDGGTSGEMSVCWRSFYNAEPVARLEVFEDNWSILAQFPDVIAKMAKWDNRNPQPDDFVQILLECGFQDIASKRHES